MKTLFIFAVIILLISAIVAKVIKWLFRDEYDTRATWSWWDK